MLFSGFPFYCFLVKIYLLSYSKGTHKSDISCLLSTVFLLFFFAPLNRWPVPWINAWFYCLNGLYFVEDCTALKLHQLGLILVCSKVERSDPVNGSNWFAQKVEESIQCCTMKLVQAIRIVTFTMMGLSNVSEKFHPVMNNYLDCTSLDCSQ